MKALSFIACLILGPYIAMLVWNYFIPELFNLPPLSYWQTVGLMSLLAICRMWMDWDQPWQ